MTKTNVQPIPSNSQRHDTPNNKTHVIKFRVTAEEKASLELTFKLLNLSLLCRSIYDFGFHLPRTPALNFPKKTNNPNPSPIGNKFGLFLFGPLGAIRKGIARTLEQVDGFAGGGQLLLPCRLIDGAAGAAALQKVPVGRVDNGIRRHFGDVVADHQKRHSFEFG